MYTGILSHIRGEVILLLTALIFRWPQRWRSHIRICSVIACDTSASAWLLESISWPGLLQNQRWTSSSERLTSEASEHLFVMFTSVGHGCWLQTFNVACHHRDVYCRPDQCVSSNSKISSLFRLNFQDESYSQRSRLLREANEQWYNVLGLARRLLWQLLHLHQERRTWKPIAKSYSSSTCLKLNPRKSTTSLSSKLCRQLIRDRWALRHLGLNKVCKITFLLAGQLSGYVCLSVSLNGSYK